MTHSVELPLADRRRSEIVAAAYAVFVERGYTAAGIADIAARLGIGHGTFYRYFKNKRDILDHVFDYGVQRLLEPVLDDLPGPAESMDELREQLLHFGRRLFTVLDEPGLIRVVLLETTAIDEELTLRALGIVDTLTSTFQTTLENGVRRGFVRPDLDPAVTAKLLCGMVLPPLFDAVRGPVGAEDRELYVQTTVDVLLRGIAAG